jgi:hypothetical protein
MPTCLSGRVAPNSWMASLLYHATNPVGVGQSRTLRGTAERWHTCCSCLRFCSSCQPHTRSYIWAQFLATSCTAHSMVSASICWLVKCFKWKVPRSTLKARRSGVTANGSPTCNLKPTGLRHCIQGGGWRIKKVIIPLQNVSGAAERSRDVTRISTTAARFASSP